jgi:two-component system, OmpR family, phosphate regulon sensor histidine kinase PhoR
VDALVLAFIGGLAVALTLVLARTLEQGRELERLRELTGVGEGSDALERRVREMLDRTAASDWQASQAAAEMRYLGDLIGVGVVRLDDAGRIDFANAAAHAFLGLAPESLLGRSTLEAFVDDRIDEIASAARQHGQAAGEVLLRDADARTLIVRGRRSPIRGTWLVLEDVSELRRLQQIRTEFIDNLSHELRTPLTTVSLLAETLAHDANRLGDRLPTRMRDRIGKVEIETGHLVQMVSELLDLSRIESGRALALLDDVDPTALARASVERLRLFADRARVKLRVEAEPDVPSLRGNEDRLGQVLVNLLHNAVKFSPDGGTVSVHVRRAGPDDVELRVADQGIGIAPAAQARIFERFYKLDRARGRSGGTGLGLAIARHIVENHAGSIRVESEEGAGATFVVRLPIAGPVEAAPGVVAPGAALPADAGRGVDAKAS